jgi:hypothetical protein
VSDLVRWLRNQWDRATAVTLVVTASLLFLFGWIGISGSRLATQQIPYLASFGLCGLGALGVGATLWLSADLRDEWRKLDEISIRLGESLGSAERDHAPAAGRAQALGEDPGTARSSVRATESEEAPRRTGVASHR